MFNNHFEVFLADTVESRRINYSIRYKVYCEEMGFENKTDFPDKMEYDVNDDHSVHFIVLDKKSGDWIGAMRLIVKKGRLLPIEQSCDLDERIVSHNSHGSVELSRLCLIKEVRRGIKDISPPHGIADEENQLKETGNVRMMPNQQKMNRRIIWGLFHAASEYGAFNNIKYCYFMTTSALAKVLGRGGINLYGIGEPCEHRGERFPFKLDATETYNNTGWKEGSHCGYRLYSELNESNYVRAASVA